MDFVSISQIVSKIVKVKREHQIILSKFGEVYLIGPLIDKNFCALCCRKRLLSSSICRIEDYKEVSNKDKTSLKIFLTDKPLNLSFSGMIELDLSRRKIIKKHIILPVPGCRVCDKTYE